MSKKIERVCFATLDPAASIATRIDGAGQTTRSAAVARPEGDPVAEVMIFQFAEMSHAADFNPALLQTRQGVHYPV